VKKVKTSRSRGNVFRDLGFSPDEAEHLKVRSDLMLNLQKAIETHGLKQAQAADLLGVTQPRISDLMRGRIDLFSIDTLGEMRCAYPSNVSVQRPASSRSAEAVCSAVCVDAAQNDTTGIGIRRRWRSFAS
jgi:predicted XRE-type DNA-binding protein